MFRTTICPSSGRLLHAVLWYFSCIHICNLVDVRVCLNTSWHRTACVCQDRRFNMCLNTSWHLPACMCQDCRFQYVFEHIMASTSLHVSGLQISICVWTHHGIEQPACVRTADFNMCLNTAWHRPACLHGYTKKYHKIACISLTWGWTLGCSKHVEDTIIKWNYLMKKVWILLVLIMHTLERLFRVLREL